jgi:hypothetical protein
VFSHIAKNSEHWAGGFSIAITMGRPIVMAIADKSNIPRRQSFMSNIYQITLTTQTGETFTGKMSRRQPELVNGFVPLATKRKWRFAPADVKRVEFTPVPAEQTEQPEEQTAE